MLVHITHSQTYNEINKIVASDRAESNRFGHAVAIDGSYAVVGAYGADANGPNRGAVYIYEYNGANWVQTQILVNSDQENYDRFGWSVAIDGNFIIVGAPGEDDDLAGNNNISKTGSAYIYENQGGTWIEVQKIIANDRSIDDEFGWSVDIDESTIIIGAHQDFDDVNGNNPIHHAGSVYIFDYNAGTGVWSQSQKIVASGRAPDINYPNGYNGEDLSDQFGHTVGVSGDYIIVGALNHDWDITNTNSSWQCGAAYIFERSGGVWTEVQKIRNSDNVAWDRFGSDVAIDSNYIAIGVWAEDESTTDTDYMKNSGSVYLFVRNGGGTWNENQKITAGSRNSGDHFGWDVKLDGDFLISGVEHDDHDENEANPLHEAGSAYVFERDGAGNFSQIQKIRGSDRDSLDVFGYAVDISGNTLIVGAFQHDFNVAHQDSIDEAGAAYIFSKYICTPITVNQSLNICPGETITVGGSTYSSEGNYTDILTTINTGCDSIIHTNVTENSAFEITQNITICYGETYDIGASSYNSPGNYTDVLSMVNSSCDSIIHTNLTVNLPLNLSVTTSENSIEANQDNAFYQWLDCNNNFEFVSNTISNEQELSITESGTYAVIINQNGCVDTSTCVYIAFLGVNELNISNYIIYPNPSAGNFTIELSSSIWNNYTIRIMNSIGQVVYNQSGINTNSYTVKDLNLQKGVYYIEVQSNNHKNTQKIVIQ